MNRREFSAAAACVLGAAALGLPQLVLAQRRPQEGTDYRELGKVVAVRGDEAEPLTVRLEPLGAVSGRLVDRAGKPVPKVRVSFIAGTNGARTTARTDQDGRFRVSLEAGQEYLLSSGRPLATAARPVKVEAGRDKELGNLPVGD